ncbi:MAG: VWA domain-containing protein [Planctomycetota bacterium]
MLLGAALVALVGHPAAGADLGRFKRAWGEAARQEGEARTKAQAAALEALAQEPDPKGADLLLRFALDPALEFPARDAAQAALAQSLGSPEVLAWAAEALAAKGKAPRKVVLCEALAPRAAEPKATVALLAALADKEPAAASAAVRALAGVKDRAVVAALVDLLGKSQGRLAGDAREALEGLTGERHPSAEEWKSWWAAHQEGYDPAAPRPAPEGEGGAEEGGRSRTITRLAPPGKGGRTVYERVESQRVLFVVDVSGSMQVRTLDSEQRDRSRLEYVKEALSAAIEEQLPEEAQFGVIAFSSAVQAMKPKLIKASAANKKKAVAWVRGLRLQGETNVYAALEAAFAVPGVDTIYFLGDGVASEGKTIITTELLGQVRRWNAGRGVKIHTIGFLAGDGKALGIVQDKGMAKELLGALAKDNDGTSRFFE